MPYRYQFSVVFFLFFVSSSYASKICENDFLFNNLKLNGKNTDLNIEADSSVINNKNLYHLSGNVKLFNEDFGIQSNDILFDNKNKKIETIGRSYFQNNSTQVISQSSTISNNDKSFNFFNAQFLDNENKLNGYAKKLNLSDSNYQIEDSSISTCPSDRRVWSVDSKSVLINKDSKLVTAEDLTFNILEAPVLYLPSLSWKLNGRHSGFLTPSFSKYSESNSNSSNGFKTTIPYYWNIEKDTDLLFKYSNYSTKGNLIGAKYRQLLYDENEFKNENIEIEGEFLNTDKITNKDRWRLKLSSNINVDDNSQLKINTERVSDRVFFRDFEVNSSASSVLNSSIEYSYKNHESDFVILRESEQILEDGSHSYQKKPEFRYHTKQEINNKNLDVDLSITDFVNANLNQTSGIRATSEVVLTEDFIEDAYKISPKISINSSKYNLDNGKELTSHVPVLNLDSKLFLEREIIFLNKPFIQTLVPRMGLTYSPSVNQSDLPLFDSELKNQDYESLFSQNIFTGKDRMTNNKSIALGIESEFIDDTGDSLLSLNIGQKYNFDEKELSITGNFINKPRSGNIFSSGDINLDRVKISQNFEYNPHSDSLEKSEIGINFYENNQDISFKYIQNTEENIDINASYSISDNTKISSGLNRSISESRTNKLYAGLEYESCCWKARVSHAKKHLGENDFDNTTDFEIVFKGLSSSGNN